jgi:uncharacterized protein YPO0396
LDLILKSGLDPISELYSSYQQASQLADRLDRFGVARDMDAPFDLWRARTEARLLEAAMDRNRAAREENQQARLAADKTVADTRQRLIEAEKQRRENGGEAVEALNAQLERTEAACAQIASDRVRFEERIRALGVEPTTRDVYEELQATGRAFAECEDKRAEQLGEERDRIKRDAWEKQALLRELQDEHRSLTERTGLVPREHHQARLAIAEACGLSPEDLPFAAELLDLHPQHEDWRLAAEVTLRGLGLTMLMDERRQAQIRSQIDPLMLDVRINFDGVDLTDRTAQPPDDRYISGRLVFKEGSPFVWWVKRRVFEQDHLCVDSADQLGGDEAKVTRHGQTSRGRRAPTVATATTGTSSASPTRRVVRRSSSTRRRPSSSSEPYTRASGRRRTNLRRTAPRVRHIDVCWIPRGSRSITMPPRPEWTKCGRNATRCCPRATSSPSSRS